MSKKNIVAKSLYLLISLVLLLSCNSNKYYTKSKSFPYSYYCIKKKRADNLKLLIFVEGIPHYSYLKIYADDNNVVSSIIIERDGGEFYQLVTHQKDGTYYYNHQEVVPIDTIKFKADSVVKTSLFVKYIQKVIEKSPCGKLEFSTWIGSVRIPPPAGVIDHLGQKQFVRSKGKYRTLQINKTGN